MRANTMEDFWAKVEKSPDCWIWHGSRDAKGYGRMSMRRQHVVAHRRAYETLRGPIPHGVLLDHTCHRPECVNPNHLRPATNKQNLENLVGAYRNNRTSGVRGVYWHAKSRKWRAMVRHNGRLMGFGLFDTIAEAEATARAARQRLFTHNDNDRVDDLAA